MYFARTSDKAGRKRQHAIADTREDAMRLVFEADPKAKTCSTSRANTLSDGRIIDSGSDIRWHQRGELEQ